MFENRVLRRISGPKKEEVAGDWRRLHNEELHNSNVLSSIIRIRWAGHLACMGKMKNSIRNSDRKTWREEITQKT
jgi:hypothetical protein